MYVFGLKVFALIEFSDEFKLMFCYYFAFLNNFEDI
jgi:hypothetical protein